MKTLWIIVALLLIVASIDTVDAQPREGLGNPVAQDELPEGEQKLVGRLSGYLGVPEDELIALKMEGLGWGDVEMTYLVARASNQPVAAIVEQWMRYRGNWEMVGASVGIDDVEGLKKERPDQPEQEDEQEP